MKIFCLSPVLHFFCAFLLLSVVSVADSSDWPNFLGPNQNGKSPEKIDIAPWPKAGPRIVWHTEIGTSYGAPAVAAGRLFIFARYRDMARLSCLDSKTGTERWRFEYPTDYEDMYGYNNGPRCCPVVDEERVFSARRGCCTA